MSSPRYLFLLGSAYRRLQQHIARHGDSVGVQSSSLAGLLLLLEKSEGLRPGEITQQLELAPSAVSGLLSRAERSGWVARRADPDDRRAGQVVITPAGRALLPRLKSMIRDLQQDLNEGFSEEELAVVARWLEQARRRLSDEEN